VSADRQLVVPIGGGTWALALDAAREVVAVGDPVPLPAAPAGLLGLVNLRGEVLPLFDGGLAVGGRATGVTGTAVVVLLAAGAAALAVDGACRLAAPDPSLPVLDVEAAVATAAAG